MRTEPGQQVETPERFTDLLLGYVDGRPDRPDRSSRIDRFDRGA